MPTSSSATTWCSRTTSSRLATTSCSPTSIEALRASDVVAGDRIRLAVNGTQVVVRGQVESIEVSDEVLAIVGDVPGVTDVVDELEVEGV